MYISLPYLVFWHISPLLQTDSEAIKESSIITHLVGLNQPTSQPVNQTSSKTRKRQYFSIKIWETSHSNKGRKQNTKREINFSQQLDEKKKKN